MVDLVFVEVDHIVSVDGAAAVEERQTIVYRGAGAGSARVETDEAASDFERRVRPDPVMLFRYSALTFNSHRIHYDLPYATAVEFYPGLVVHGPLTASLLIDLCARQFGGNRLKRFSFRAVSPAFAGEELRLHGRASDAGIALIAAADGRVVMRAVAERS
jgi:3-methylfumaryl-CoA hydratase